MHMWMLIIVNSAPGVPKTHPHLGSCILEKSEIPSLRPKNVHRHHSSLLGTFGTSPSTRSHPPGRCTPHIPGGPISYSRGVDLLYHGLGPPGSRLDLTPLDSAEKTSHHCPVTSITSLNPIAPSSPPPHREDWGKLIGLAEDCTLCTQGNCGYIKPQNGDTHVNTTAWLSARHHNARRQRCLEFVP